jgi:hypothetical protein
MISFRGPATQDCKESSGQHRAAQHRNAQDRTGQHTTALDRTVQDSTTVTEFTPFYLLHVHETVVLLIQSPKHNLP